MTSKKNTNYSGLKDWQYNSNICATVLCGLAIFPQTWRIADENYLCSQRCCNIYKCFWFFTSFTTRSVIWSQIYHNLLTIYNKKVDRKQSNSTGGTVLLAVYQNHRYPCETRWRGKNNACPTLEKITRAQLWKK